MGNVTTGSNYSNTTKYTTTPNGKTFKIEVENGGIVDYSKPNKMSGVLLKALGAKGVDLGAQIASGYISDYFNQRSENRADERNRRLIKDTPQLQVEGRRKAGLNPYTLEGAQLPGMSAQSTTDTSSNSDFLNDLMMQERFALDREMAEADIDLKRADAEKARADAAASRGTEARNQEKWPVELRKLYAETQSSEAKAFVDMNTKDMEVAMTGQELRNLILKGEESIRDIWLKETDIEKRNAEILDIYSQMMYREVQAELAKSQISLNYSQVQKVFAEIKNLDADTIVKMTQGAVNIEEANRLKAVTAGVEIQNALDVKYGGSERVTNMVYGGLNAVSGLVGSVAKLIKPFNIETTSETTTTTKIPNYKDETTTTIKRDTKTYTR